MRRWKQRYEQRGYDGLFDRRRRRRAGAGARMPTLPATAGAGRALAPRAAMTTVPLIFVVPTRSLTQIVAVTTQWCGQRGRYRVIIGTGHTLTHWENRSQLTREKLRLSPRVI
jgi:hypothetical protein